MICSTPVFASLYGLTGPPSEHILFSMADTLIYEDHIHGGQELRLQHNASLIRGKEQILANKSDVNKGGLQAEDKKTWFGKSRVLIQAGRWGASIP